MGEQGPLFSQRFELQVIAPTGHYDRTAAVSPGSNFWSFDPYWAVTVWASPKLSFSGRFNYLWNARNSDPNAAFGSGATSTQAGQALHGNFAVEYEIRQGLVAGLSGYWLKQISDTRGTAWRCRGGASRSWRSARPRWSRCRQGLPVLQLYREFAARNRTQGDKFQIRYDHHF